MLHTGNFSTLRTAFLDRSNSTQNGAQIRYAYTSPTSPKAIIFVFPGLSEYIEKYEEVVAELSARNYAVCVHDWRGQGLSYRGKNRKIRTATHFSNDVADAHALVSAITHLPSAKGVPCAILAHSMGGHLALRLMHDHPNTFAFAALNAPLQGIPSIPNSTVTLAKHTARLFPPHQPIMGEKPWSAANYLTYANTLTSDPDSVNRVIDQLTQNPDLAMGTLTFSWLAAALESITITRNPEYLKQIKTPILLTMAEHEKIVTNTAIEHAARYLPNLCDLICIKDAQHETLMERPAIRARFWQAFDAHIANHI